MKKVMSLVLTLLVSICFTSCIQSNQENSNIRENIDTQDQVIYILYKDGYSFLQYLTSDLEKVGNVKVKGGWDLCSTENGKVYVTIAGNANFSGDCLKVIERGKITKTIDLTYDLPLEIRYNSYNKKAYVSHKHKITFANENCISVIDTLTDKEEYSFYYNELIQDFTFSEDNKMYISSQNVKTYEAQIDVVNLNSNEIEKHIVVDVPLTSIEYCESTKMLYGVSDRKESPLLYTVDCKEDRVSSLSIGTSNPSQLVLDKSGDRPLLYISNVDVHNAREGHIITIYDLIEGKEINTIENIDGINAFIVDKGNVYASAVYRDRIYKVDLITNEMIETDIPYPFRIAK